MLPQEDGDRERQDAHLRAYATLLDRWGLAGAASELLCRQWEDGRAAMSRCESAHRMICATCTLPVRGLFAFCGKCFHGGHPEHMRQWIAEFKGVCPVAGCECQCAYFGLGEAVECAAD